jgi:amino acid adenylation domain-containing protein
LRTQLRERKAEILNYLGGMSTCVTAPITRASRSVPLPLSFGQERLWFLEQLEPGNTAYNICRAMRITGSLDSKILEASLREISRRHESLRTHFGISKGKPVQIIEADASVDLVKSDLRQNSLEEQNRETSRLIADEAHRPFDLSQAPLLRARLLQLNDTEHILILATHHIVSDAWSMGILTRELWSVYGACAHGRSSPFRERDIQYADFAVWQRNWLQGEVLQSQLSYWKRQLNDISILNLPTDRTRPPRQSFRGARHRITIESELTNAINEFSHNEGITPFMMLLTAFQVLLYRYSGQEDVLVGSPIANRSGAELDSLIGFFVNTLVLRADLSGNPTFREALTRVREVCLGAYAHQDLPFEKLVDELKIERDQSRNPLFQVMFALQNATRPFGGIPGLQIEPIEIESERSIFDLSLFLREREGRYIGYIEYSTDLFNRDRVERMADHLKTLLKSIVPNPDCRIAELPILPEAERHQLLVEWNDTATDYPRDKCIHQLFEEQVERTADVIAVDFDGQSLTYQELNRRANQLAHYLVGLGVGPEKLVGICIDRSLEMVIGLLGILKSGGAYVPLDPAYPQERLQFMLKDAQCSVLLTQEKYLRLSTNHQSLIYVCLDRDWRIIAQKNEENCEAQARSNNLAYVIYTSGSTGQPKGVAIEHRNTVNLLTWAKTVYEPAELRGVLASTSICFDLSVFEIFLPLICGGKVIIGKNALSIHDLPSKREITLVNTVPSAMAQMLALGPLPESISVVNLAGEPLKSELVTRLYEGSHVAKVYDLYGPTETTTYSTFTLRDPNGPETIGRPIANTQIHILDNNLETVPVGVEGEIYIGGAGVARGYLNRAEESAERFVRHAFSGDLDARLYRSGDRARYRPDGSIELLGRNDHQVKIRGYRIELGEIESMLNQHPRVKESVIVTRDPESACDKQLVAYYVPSEPSAASVRELRDFLRAKLPDYMIPSGFVQLDALPVTLTGKVDRNALPPSEDGRLMPDQGFVEPRTEIEELIAQVWREVLKLDRIGAHDNFFELGGHSLLAIEIAGRLNDICHKQVPLATIFEAATVAELAATVEKTICDRPHSLPAIVRAPRDGALPLSMNQEHIWRLDRIFPGTPLFNIPYVYRLTGVVNVPAVEGAILEMFRRHETLRTVFYELNGNPVQHVKPLSKFPLPLIDLHDEHANKRLKKAATIIFDERSTPFDLGIGPLARIKLLRLTETDHLLLVTVHHIISDHWSMRLFRRELAITYDALSSGKPSPLTEPTFQFADYAYWERTLLNQGGLDVQRQFWTEKLLKRKTVHKYGQSKAVKIAREYAPIEIDRQQFTEVRDFANRKKITPFIVVLTTLFGVCHLISQESHLRIALVVANRRVRGAESIFGYLANTVVLPIDVTRQTTFSDLLEVTRNGVLTIQEHQEFPFEALARSWESETRWERELLCPVLVSYNVESEPYNTTGGTFAPLLQEIQPLANFGITGFDFAFTFKEFQKKLSGTVNFATAQHPSKSQRPIGDHFKSILEVILRRPRTPICAPDFCDD